MVGNKLKRPAAAAAELGPLREGESVDISNAGKKSVREDILAQTDAGEVVDQDDEGMGEFEDAWMDEEEDDDEDGDVVVAPNSDEEDNEEEEGVNDGMALEELQKQSASMDDDAEDDNVNVYLPGQKLAEGEVLVADNSVYEMLHQMHVEWPCLSFDFLRDNLGMNRKTVSIVA